MERGERVGLLHLCSTGYPQSLSIGDLSLEPDKGYVTLWVTPPGFSLPATPVRRPDPE